MLDTFLTRVFTHVQHTQGHGDSAVRVQQSRKLLLCQYAKGAPWILNHSHCFNIAVEKTRMCHISRQGRINFQTPPHAVSRHAVRREPRCCEAAPRHGCVRQRRPSIPRPLPASPRARVTGRRRAAATTGGTGALRGPAHCVRAAPGLQHKPDHRSTPILKVLPKTTNKAVRGKDAC